MGTRVPAAALICTLSSNFQLSISIERPVTAVSMVVLQKASKTFATSVVLHAHYHSNTAKFYALPQWYHEICPQSHSITAVTAVILSLRLLCHSLVSSKQIDTGMCCWYICLSKSLFTKISLYFTLDTTNLYYHYHITSYHTTFAMAPINQCSAAPHITNTIVVHNIHCVQKKTSASVFFYNL